MVGIAAGAWLLGWVLVDRLDLGVLDPLVPILVVFGVLGRVDAWMTKRWPPGA